MLSPFPCSPVIRECLWNKTHIEKKKRKVLILNWVELFWLGTTISFLVRIHIFSRKVGYLLSIWMNAEKSHKQQLLSVILWTRHYHTLIGLQFLEKVFYWSKNKARIKNVYVTYSFHEILICFWLTLVDIDFILRLISHYIREKLHANTYLGGNKWWKFPPASYTDVGKSCFCSNAELKIPCQQFFIFLSFRNILNSCLITSKFTLHAFAEVQTSIDL